MCVFPFIILIFKFFKPITIFSTYIPLFAFPTVLFPLQLKRHVYTERERMEKVFYANGKQKKAGVAIFISDKIDLKEDYKK